MSICSSKTINSDFLIFSNRDIKKETFNFNKSLIIAIAAPLIAIAVIAGSLTAAYFLSPNFAAVFNGHMSIADGLLCIGVPIVGTSLLINSAIYIYRKHQQGKYGLDSFEKDKLQEFKNTLKGLVTPTRRQMIVTGIVLLVLSAMGIAGYLVFHYVPVANQWIHGEVLSALQSNVQIWQALTYIGGGCTAVALTTGWAMYLFQKRFEDKKNLESAIEYGYDTDECESYMCEDG